MDSKPKKFYKTHEFDSRSHLEFYFSDKEDMVYREDILKFPMMTLHYVFSRGFIRGNLLIDLSLGSFIHRLYLAANIFKDMIIMKFNEKCRHGNAIDVRHTELASREEFCSAVCLTAVAATGLIGFIRGKLLIDFSIGAFIHHLYSAANIFQDMIIMKCSDKCSMEVRRWHGDRTGAFSWNHTKTSVEELEGISDQTQDKELDLKASIKHIVTCNLEEENLTHPLVLPLADCIISAAILDVISKDEEDYMRNLEKVSNLLKIGGHLILLGLLNMTYITAGADRFHWFKYDESFVRSALSKLGFVIDYCAVQRRSNMSDLVDYSHVIVIIAHKEK